MAGIPIWTERTTAGVSAFFDVVTPPVTISVDGLAPHEVVNVRSSNQDDSGHVPFRSGGNVQLDYNNTKILLVTDGRYCLEMTADPAGPIDAQRGAERS